MTETAETNQDVSSALAPKLPTAACALTVIRDPLHPDRSRESISFQPGQWLSEAVPAECLTSDEWVAVDSGRVIERSTWERHLLYPGAEVILYPRLANSTITKIATGIMFPPLGIYWGMRSIGAPSWVGAIMMGAFGGGLGAALGVQTVLSGSVRSSLPAIPSYGTGGSDLESSATYGSHGIQTSPVGEGTL